MAVRRLLACCLLESGQPAEAQSILQPAFQSGPDSEASWLLSRALLMRGRNAEARAALAAAAQLTIPDPLQREPAPFVGAAQCKTCHAQEFQSQQNSNHAQTLQVGTQVKTLPWPTNPFCDSDNNHVSHAIRQFGKSVEITTSVDNQTFAALIDYAIGSNHQGRSFVGRDRDGQSRELRISQYPSAPNWARTTEHPQQPPTSSGYLGRPISDESVRRCVHCHSTNFRAVQKPHGRPEAADRGIGCERCHGPGGHHLRAVETGFADVAIARPRLASAERIVALCGECHQAPESLSPSAPGFIRFQAPSLVLSRCFTESGSLSCVTCHNPHKNASRNASDYERICMKCHPSATSGNVRQNEAAARARTWKACSTGAERDCLGCHMPRVANAIPRSTFTDHFIRTRDARRPLR
jgi:hypothetical protein